MKTEEMVADVANTLTEALNTAVEVDYPDFPPLLVIPVQGENETYAFDVIADEESVEGLDEDLVSEVLARAKVWVAETLAEVLSLSNAIAESEDE